MNRRSKIRDRIHDVLRNWFTSGAGDFDWLVGTVWTTLAVLVIGLSIGGAYWLITHDLWWVLLIPFLVVGFFAIPVWVVYSLWKRPSKARMVLEALRDKEREEAKEKEDANARYFPGSYATGTSTNIGPTSIHSYSRDTTNPYGHP